jgi:ABC-type amino acid transport substrate-binding protein
MESTVIVASLAGSDFRNSSSLSGATLALPESGQFRDILENHQDVANRPEYTIMLPQGGDECLAALEDGTADAVVTDMASINYHA